MSSKAIPAGKLQHISRADSVPAAEQMKKVLSANATASLSVESIMEDVDVRGKMTRDEFEELCGPVLQRVRKPLEQVLPTCRCRRRCHAVTSLKLAAGLGIRPHEA